MKKIILLLLFSFFLSTFAFSQECGWQSLNSVLPYASYSDVFAIGNEVWITSGSSNELFYNDAAGTTDFVTYATPDEFLCLHMINSNLGYAGAQNGRVFSTTDGGENWALIGLTGAAVSGISFPPNGEEPGYCCGEGGRIYSITSAGVSAMTSNVVANFQSISFPVSSSEGWVCGEDVILHYNGNEWLGQGSPAGNSLGIFFVDNNKGWAAGSTGYGSGKIIHVITGANWTLQTDPVPSKGILSSVFFLDDGLHGWAAGNFGKVLNTSDGGENWNELEIGASSLLRGIHFTSLTNGFVVGNNGEAFRYGLLTGIEEIPNHRIS